MESETSPRLQLSSPSRTPRKRSAWKCAAISCVILIVGFIGILSCVILYGLWTFLDNARNPHKSLLHNGTTTNQVVRPLVQVDTKYDLAVTVYARKADDPQWISEALEKYHHAEVGGGDGIDGGGGVGGGGSDGKDEALAGLVGVKLQEVQIEPDEEILFAGIVERGLSLSSKSKDITFTFDLPLQRFYDDFLYAKDVRLGVGIIPTSPSKLDRLDAWTDWRPKISLVPKLANSIIEEIKFDSDTEHTSDRIDALEHMAVSFPLVEFHNFEEKCPTGNATEDTPSEEDEEEDLYASVFADDEDDEKPAKKKTDKGMVEKRRHPYIVSRSHVYIINETRLFDRKAFDKKHKNLRESSCGQKMKGVKPSKWLCNRDYLTNGQWETRFGLLPAEEGGKKELAYGPYISNLHNSAGPRDIHRLPVTIGNCSGIPRDHSGDPEMMTVKHTMRFSSLTPARARMIDGVDGPKRLPANATHDETMLEHDEWEQLSGLLGNKAEGAHPWRRFIISFASDVMIGLPIGFLSIAYWYTRTTTLGISPFATYLGGVSVIVKSVGSLAIILVENQGFIPLILALFFEGCEVTPSILQLRLVWPLEFVPGSKWQVRRVHPSHRERQSMRIEAQIAWAIRLLLITACLAIIYLPHYYNLHLLSPHVSRKPKDTVHWFLRSRLVQSTFASCALSSTILQAEHNRRAGTYAGDFAITAYLRLARMALGWLYFLPWVIGKYEVRQSFDLDDMVWAGVLGWNVWQAATLPRVEQREPDTEED